MAGSDRLGTAYADCLVFLSRCNRDVPAHVPIAGARADERVLAPAIGTCADRKSTRLNSSHGYRSYAGFCLKKRRRWVAEFFLPPAAQEQTCRESASSPWRPSYLGRRIGEHGAELGLSRVGQSDNLKGLTSR